MRKDINKITITMTKHHKTHLWVSCIDNTEYNIMVIICHITRLPGQLNLSLMKLVSILKCFVVYINVKDSIVVIERISFICHQFKIEKSHATH